MFVCLSVCSSVFLQLVIFLFPEFIPEDYDIRVFLMLSVDLSQKVMKYGFK